MSTYQTRSFQHAGNTYETRIASDGHTIRVRVFINNRPANGYTYSVETLTQVDAAMQGGSNDPIEELIKAAEHDVKTGVWEQYVAAVKAAENAGT